MAALAYGGSMVHDKPFTPLQLGLTLFFENDDLKRVRHFEFTEVAFLRFSRPVLGRVDEFIIPG
jgi:hypothetical protein